MEDQLAMLHLMPGFFWRFFADKLSIAILVSMIVILQWKRDIDAGGRYLRFLNRKNLDIQVIPKFKQTSDFRWQSQFSTSDYSGMLKYLWEIYGPVTLNKLPGQRKSIQLFISKYRIRNRLQQNMTKLKKFIEKRKSQNQFYTKSRFL